MKHWDFSSLNLKLIYVCLLNYSQLLRNFIKNQYYNIVYAHHLSGNENKSRRYDFDLSLPIQRASDTLVDLKAWWNIWRAFWINLSSSRRMNHFVWTSRLAEGLVWVYYPANYGVFNFFVTLYNKLIISKSKFWLETNRNTSSQLEVFSFHIFWDWWKSKMCCKLAHG